MGVWEQVASIYAVTNGLFDKVSVEKIKDAQTAMLTRLWTDHKEAMRTLNKGDKPTDEMLKAIEKMAKTAAKGFED
jgi:F-type H+-transporting ATPase subunit alpha